MNSVCRIVFLVLITLSIGLSAVRPESKIESKAKKKAESNFNVHWTDISYSKTVSVRNPDVSKYGQQVQGQDVSERMSLSCEIEILDPNFVLGISRVPVIEEMKDENDENIKINLRSSSSLNMRYEAPRYERRFVAPQKQPQWKTAIRSALRLPPSESSRPQWIEEIRPVSMQINIDVESGTQSCEKIGHVKGYFYALIAESFEYIDVPFKESDKWVRLTPDIEVQIRDAYCDGSSYRLSTKARPEGGGFSGMLSVGSYIPARLVTGRQLIGPDNKPVRQHQGISILPYHIGGNSSGGGSSMGLIKKIRYVIAVNPTHYEIPFVLEDIPLPKP